MKSTRNVTVKIKGFVVFVFICCFGSGALAADYYVSPKGSAPWSECTNISTPCSLDTAKINADDDDIVYFRGGTYVLSFIDGSGGNYWRSAFMPSNSGSDGHPITFMAYPGEIPVLDNSVNANQTNAVSSFGVNGQNFIIFDGFHTTVVPSSIGNGMGTTIKSTSGVIVRNCDITGNPGGQSNNDCVRIEGTFNVKVYNCKIHESTGTDNSVGFKLYNARGTEIYNNDVYSNTMGIYDKSEGVNNKFYKNFVYDNSVGLALGTESGSTVPHGSEYYQNIVLNSTSHNIRLLGNMATNDIDFYNNTIIGDTPGGLAVGSSNFYDLHAWNNIYYDNGYAVAYYRDEAFSYSDFNCYYSTGNLKFRTGDTGYSLSAWKSATDWDDNSITSDPSFVNNGGSLAEDYKRISYPTNGRGGSYASVMGAYITGNEVIGYSGEEGASPPSSPPSSPPYFSANN